MTAGEEAHIKIFTLPVPNSPVKSGDINVFKFKGKPVALTHSHAASNIQSLPNGRLLYTQSSLTSPNEVFIIRGLDSKNGSDLVHEQVTHFNADNLKSKNLYEGESFWFTGAEGRKVQGWALKPKGWKEGVTKEFPVVLLIHGGPQGAWEDQWSTRWNPNGQPNSIFETLFSRSLPLTWASTLFVQYSLSKDISQLLLTQLDPQLSAKVRVQNLPASRAHECLIPFGLIELSSFTTEY